MAKKDKVIIVGIFLLVVTSTVFYFDLIPNISIANIAQVRTGLVDVILPEEDIKKEITLLGKAEVSYTGGVVNRNNNIEIGIAKINGTIVPNGTEFSFLKTLGPVPESDGFKEAKSFYEGEVVLGLGGGLCHVSTTLFRSVLDAGLTITERHNHTFTVPYYKTGLDATISSSGPDLKFINNTGYDITIKGYIKDKVAVFEIYGVDDGRVPIISDVEITNYKFPPKTQFIPSRELPVGVRKCEQMNQGGFTAKRVYQVLYPDGEIKDMEVFDSVYKPMPKICHIGVDDATDFTGCNFMTEYSRVTGVKCPK